MKTIRIILLILFVEFFLACDQTVDNSLMLDKPVSFELHQTRFDLTEGISLRFDSILSDSRCPLNVNCVWEGNAAVQFTLSNAGSKHIIVLNTHGGTNFPKDTLISGYLLNLLEVLPYPSYPKTSSKSPEVIVSISKQ
jgi:hypothetical protein